MPLGMLARPIARGLERRRRRILAAERADRRARRPRPDRSPLAPCEAWDGGVIAMQLIASQDMTLNQRVRRAQRRRASIHLIGQCRRAQLDALADIALALAVQRLILAEPFEQDHRRQVRTGDLTSLVAVWTACR